MDYEKKYKEALERAREIHNKHRAQCSDVMVKVFPELKESKDERIRKGLIALLKFSLELENETKEQAIAWLEKQGEQKPTWSEEDSKNLNSVKWIIENSENLNRIFETINSPEYIKKYFIDWLKSLKERMKGSEK